MCSCCVTFFKPRRVGTITTADYKNRFPPGPQPLPLLGNVHQLPADYQHKTFAEWGRRYGDVVFARLFRTPVLILNSVQAAQDLMDKRGFKYSDRPRFVLLVELIGWDSVLTLMRYGERSRKHRKWMRDAFQNKASLESYRPMQRRETYTLLSGLIKNAEDHAEHCRRFAASMVLEVAYGHRVKSLDDNPGSVIVDFVPILKHLPTWFPGCSFKQHALDVWRSRRAFLDTPFQMVRDAMTAGTATSCLTVSLIEQCSGSGGLSKEDEEDIKGTAGQLYSAGTETTFITLSTFLLAMAIYPDVLKKAQEEIDRVTGNQRLPDFGDRESLPYLECILKETYRWNSPAPLGIPHRVTSDDIYRGYHIPEGCMIIPNIWGMMHNPDMYPEPEEFQPERFLKANIIDPSDVVFGFGRRLCVGQAFADSSLWLAMANILATLDICKPVDDFGNEITPKPTFQPGFTSPPKPFTCIIRPRSSHALDLIQSANVDVAL
ncbi:O-methylsterigmatocystin oxidoreductase [Grifola frondosa]|uniref:O-methylsterigmatocystin oxidoreductase n=1 Tax=Grifola frondosa TaxID=5627 RepID=A0A1C7MD24_GRIFR|nr:O-methylsterigmatocystin oxidoreductase [Grifola frondosa]